MSERDRYRVGFVPIDDLGELAAGGVMPPIAGSYGGPACRPFVSVAVLVATKKSKRRRRRNKRKGKG